MVGTGHANRSTATAQPCPAALHACGALARLPPSAQSWGPHSLPVALLPPRSPVTVNLEPLTSAMARAVQVSGAFLLGHHTSREPWKPHSPETLLERRKSAEL